MAFTLWPSEELCDYEEIKLAVVSGNHQRALAGYEKALGPDHTSTLATVNNLGIPYTDLGKQKEAEEMYQRALAGYGRVLGPDHSRTRTLVDRSNALSAADVK
ncbi:hypothetical protein N7499_003799 [Penicillium canescens]|uniref:Uncharacterized protein n=1 Tax=Penicillium canescens TaxID=5083 RepID=A0AAD6I9X9_PENCN|nr:uncharacterized protein N7446_012063 [Penicillium canescens]KAJ5991665.1 hypothetical protein N7522_011872 [Penicillium canescens]KAJ6038647.1 hypothetical protein N7460_007364 [Penicillium canescens]KAJ6047229.1 hypothetical protein N7446_012063 [Penicillium canescens]KAJ6060045.1 hypothetical protein N7444_002977 [Penicillium canescens]KAJ6088952.1 hypothetical protein N7499_003799 [Penicillium canescens]